MREELDRGQYKIVEESDWEEGVEAEDSHAVKHCVSYRKVRLVQKSQQTRYKEKNDSKRDLDGPAAKYKTSHIYLRSMVHEMNSPQSWNTDIQTISTESSTLKLVLLCRCCMKSGHRQMMPSRRVLTVNRSALCHNYMYCSWSSCIEKA